MSTKKLKLPSYGGQALIEGVLMRGSRYMAAAFRKPDGGIEIKTEKLEGIYGSGIAKIVFLRGLLLLWDALFLGTQYLTLSANFQTGEDEKIEGPSFVLAMLFSFGIAIAVFFLAPAAVASWVGTWLHWPSIFSNLFEGLIRLTLLILYLYLIGKMSDIARVFAYHGAEHKTINAFEAGVPLTPGEVKKCSLYHPRCGTGFLLIVVVVSVLVYSLLGKPPLLLLLLSRLALLPVIIMLAYEYMRWISNHLDVPFVKALAWPNMALQRLTTRQPDEAIIEVAISAFNAMFALEKPVDQS